MFKLITRYKTKECVFNDDPIRHFKKSYDNESRRALKTTRSRTTERNMVRFVKWSISVNDRINDRAMDRHVR